MPSAAEMGSVSLVAAAKKPGGSELLFEVGVGVNRPKLARMRRYGSLADVPESASTGMPTEWPPDEFHSPQVSANSSRPNA